MYKTLSEKRPKEGQEVIQSLSGSLKITSYVGVEQRVVKEDKDEDGKVVKQYREPRYLFTDGSVNYCLYPEDKWTEVPR